MEQVIIREKEFQKARKAIKEAQNEKKKIIFSSNDDELNKKVLEKEPINTLLINLSERKDRGKQRDSGFNQVLAKIAKKNKISIGINLDEILNAKSLKEKSEIISRIRQNIKLSNKDHLQMEFISEKGKKTRNHDLRALGLSLGMPTSMTKNF